MHPETALSKSPVIFKRDLLTCVSQGLRDPGVAAEQLSYYLSVYAAVVLLEVAAMSRV